MLTSKQRAHLRSIASTYDTIMQVGKGGVTPNIVKTISDALDSENAIIRAVAMIIDGNENRYTQKEIYNQVSNYLIQKL